MSKSKEFYQTNGESTFRISLIKGMAEVSRELQVGSFSELEKFIQEHSWSHGLFNNGRRTVANFRSTDLIALDIDEGMTIDEAVKIFKEFQHAIIPSKSHQIEKKSGSTLRPPCDRFRVILRLSEPITKPEVYTQTWRSLKELCPTVDEGAKDCSRLWYACPHQAVSISNTGKVVEPVNLTEKTHNNFKVVVSATGGPKKIGKLSKRSKDFLTEGAPDGEWNTTLFAVAKDCQEQGMEKEEFIKRVSVMAPDPLDNCDLATIDSAYKNDPKYGPRTAKNEGLLKFAKESKLIVNIKDRREARLWNPPTGEILEIDEWNVKDLFGKGYDNYACENRIIAKLDYLPRKTETLFEGSQGIAVFNTYSFPHWRKPLFFGEELEPVDELPGIYAIFFRHLTAFNEDSFQYLLDWMATSLQDRNLTILCAIGEEGIGKGILGELLEDIHGRKNFVKVRDNVFKEKWNAPLSEKTLVYIDEIKITSKEALDRLKDVVNWDIEIEKKGKDPVSVTNYASFYLSSNNWDAIELEEGQRRFSIIQLTDMKLKDAHFITGKIDDYVKELRSKENVSRLARYLYFRKVQSNMIVPFESERTRDVKEAGLKEWEHWVIHNWCPAKIGREFRLTDLQDAIKKECSYLKTHVGRRKIEQLAKKFPTIFSVVQRGAGRFIRVHKPDDAHEYINPDTQDLINEVEKEIASKSTANPVNHQ